MFFKGFCLALVSLCFFNQITFSAPAALTEVDVIRYAVFCPKFRQELKKLEIKGQINNYCVLKTDKPDGRTKKILKQNRYGDIKKYKEQVAKITEILALTQFVDKKTSSKTREIYKNYLPQNASGNYQVYLEKNYTADEVALVKKHSEALKELSR